MAFLSHLPPEIILDHILPYLGPVSLCNLKKLDKTLQPFIDKHFERSKTMTMEPDESIGSRVEAVKTMTKKCSKLRILNLLDCGGLKSRYLAKLLSRNSQLQEIHMRGSVITSKTIEVIKTLPNLNKLVLNGAEMNHCIALDTWKIKSGMLDIKSWRWRGHENSGQPVRRGRDWDDGQDGQEGQGEEG